MGGKRGGTQTVTQKADPWSQAIPYLTGAGSKAGILPEAESLYIQGKEQLLPDVKALQEALIKDILANQMLHMIQRNYYQNMFNQLAGGGFRYNPFTALQRITLPTFYVNPQSIIKKEGG